MGGMRHACAVRVEDLGPFLLGQLSAEKSDTLKVAIARCPSCTADVDCLRPVVAAMAQSKVGVPLDADTQPRPVPEFVSTRVLASVRDHESASRRRRWLRVAAVAAMFAVVLAGLVGVVLRTTARPGETIALSGPTAATGLAVVSTQDWGTAITLDMRGLVPGTTYGAWLADGMGKRVPAGTFRPFSDGSVRLDLGASMSLDKAARVGVTALGGGGDVLTAPIPAPQGQ